MQRVLITGAAGGIGGFLRRGLPPLGWPLRLLDTRPIAGAAPDEDAVVADINDAPALAAAMKDVATVVHLAGISVEAPFRDILASNIEGAALFCRARVYGSLSIIMTGNNSGAPKLTVSG